MRARAAGPTRLFVTSTLIASVVASVLCVAVRADDLSTGKSFRNRTATFAPIGKVYSLGSVMIDGRRMAVEQMIWGGELMSADEASATVDLDQVGRVVLCKRGSARLFTSNAKDPLNHGEVTLEVVAVAGSLIISLQPNVVANVEIGDWVIGSSRGAKFRVRIVAGEPVVEVEKGEIVKELQEPRIRYIVVVAKPDPRTGRYVESNQKSFRMPPRAVKPFPVFVNKLRPATRRTNLETLATPVAYQTAPATERASGVEVEFCLVDNPAIGWINAPGARCATTSTNQDGVAEVQFFAGPDKGNSKMRATVVESKDDYQEWEVEVYKTPWYLRPRNIAIMAAIAGGGTVCVFLCGPSRGPLRQEPPPQIP